MGVPTKERPAIVELPDETKTKVPYMCHKNRCIAGVDFRGIIAHVIYDIKGLCLPHYCFDFKHCPLCGKELRLWQEKIGT